MGCCRDFAERFVMLISGLMFLLAVLILGFSAFLAAQLGDEFSELDLEEFQNPVILSLVFGSGLAVFSLTGLIGACKGIKCLLFIFLIGSMFMAIGVTASGIALLVESGALDEIGNENVLDAKNSVEFTVLHINLGLFEGCCEQEALRCDDNGANEAFCVDEEGEDIIENVLDFLGEDKQTCDTLEDLDINLDENADCADEETFVTAVTELIDENIVRLAVANIVAGVIMFLLLFSTCYLLWTTRDDDKKKNDGGCC